MASHAPLGRRRLHCPLGSAVAGSRRPVPAAPASAEARASVGDRARGPAAARATRSSSCCSSPALESFSFTCLCARSATGARCASATSSCERPRRRRLRTTPTSKPLSSRRTRAACSWPVRRRGTSATESGWRAWSDPICWSSGSGGWTTSSARAGTTACRSPLRRRSSTSAWSTARTTTRTARWRESRPR